MRNVLKYLENSTRKYPYKIAVIDEKQSYTYTKLSKISKQIGSVLANLKKHNEPVAVVMEKNADTLKEQYKIQMYFYKKALEKSTGKKVKEVYLYSLYYFISLYFNS